jgi:IclR family mhp operon transcriptional activator
LREEDDIQSLRYGIEALRLLNGRESISTADLVTALGISRGTAYRVINTLHALGYVARVSERRGSRYRLSVRVRRLSAGFDGDRWLLHVAQPLMLEFTREHGWPLTLSTPAGDRFFVRYTTDHATQRVLRRYRAGFYRSVLLAGSGLICLAHQHEPMLSATIRELQRAYDPRVPVMRDPSVPLPNDEPALRALLARIREQGYARYGEAGDRETSLSIPLHHAGHFVGTLAMRVMNVAARSESSLRDYLRLVRAIGAKIESGLAAAVGGHGAATTATTTTTTTTTAGAIASASASASPSAGATAMTMPNAATTPCATATPKSSATPKAPITPKASTTPKASNTQKTTTRRNG